MKIVKYPHPALRHKARLLTSIDNRVRQQAAEMLTLMYEAKGLGLAAPQVALPYQMLVMNPTADPQQRDRERVLLNPVLLEYRGSVEGEEGCLSFPGLFQKVRRFRNIKVQAYDLQGQQVLLDPSDPLESRILQHEIDHLQGILFIDKMGPLGRLASRGMLKEFEREYRRSQEKGEIPPDAEIEKTLAGLEALA